jgi:hypothetical protein
MRYSEDLYIPCLVRSLDRRELFSRMKQPQDTVFPLISMLELTARSVPQSHLHSQYFARLSFS